MEGTSYI